jgi:hypothetical protein
MTALSDRARPTDIVTVDRRAAIAEGEGRLGDPARRRSAHSTAVS